MVTTVLNLLICLYVAHVNKIFSYRISFNLLHHKSKCGNKENKHKIPYHFPQRRRHQNGTNDDDYDDDDDEEEKSQQSGNSSESENENNIPHHQSERQRLSHKQTPLPKILVDAGATTLNGTGK